MENDNKRTKARNNSKSKSSGNGSAGIAGKKRDISSKNVFHNPLLCAQFLRDNVNIPILKNVQPEDIEDVSERYRPYLGTEFETDIVKRIQLHDKTKGMKYEPLFLISLIEHKSQVDYNVSLQLLKYMVCIWLDYGKEMELEKPGITSRKSFRYPTVIPVVYYEGKAAWTADRHFRSRISRNEMFKNWIPDFSYEVVRLHDYTNEELLARGNEMSLIMLFNKVQNAVDLSEFLKLPEEKLNQMIKDTPETILDIIVSVMESLCFKIGATEEETEDCVQKVKGRKMGYLFENMEKMDIQAERRKTEKAEKKAEAACKRAEAACKEADDARKEADDARKEAEISKENQIQTLIEICQEMGTTKAVAISKLMKKCGLDNSKAIEKVELYWKIQ